MKSLQSMRSFDCIDDFSEDRSIGFSSESPLQKTRSSRFQGSRLLLCLGPSTHICLVFDVVIDGVCTLTGTTVVVVGDGFTLKIYFLAQIPSESKVNLHLKVKLKVV